MDYPDNITVSPRGGIVLCEDGDDEQYLRGLTQQGQVFDFALNVFNEREWAGATFSPDGETLFVNIQGDTSKPGPGNLGRTIAIWGPGKTEPSERPPSKPSLGCPGRSATDLYFQGEAMRLTRNRVAAIGVAAAAVAATPLASAESEHKTLFEFGLVADAQYCDCDPKGTRHYRESPAKLAEAAETFNQEDVDFAVQVGDIIDRYKKSFDEILPAWEQVEAPRHNVLGNHDFPVPTDEVVDILDMPNQYYDFSRDGWRFIVIDTNDISTYANPDGSAKDKQGENALEVLKWAGDINAQAWNGGVSEEQMTWLQGVLDDSATKGEKVVVLGHMPVEPLNVHNAWNDDAIIQTLEAHDNVVAYFNGHNHAGNYHAERNGIHYVTFQGMVETPDTNAYSVLRVYPNRLEIDRYGREPDRTLQVAHNDK
ncbi:alkaline phosphatase PhoX [Amycolatopsis palatopharyngis]|uniref:alkaline phosphatase PhoX n=1 Tax=Amycolatopsis palatopharyngis TaxID=187982 RepID=UPI0013BEA389|nr:alkaline phosphatase PhoX [Amycolatopsis palatopharyngis]